MKKVLVLCGLAFLVLAASVTAEECIDGCLDINIQGHIGLRDGQYQNVLFTPPPAGSTHRQAEFDAKQYIDGWGWGKGDFTGEGTALKEQALSWGYEDGPAEHFGAAYLGAYGNWGVDPDCRESELKVDTYAWSKTQTSHEQGDNFMSMNQYADMSDGGKIYGYGDPAKGGFEIDHTAGSYQKIGDPSCDPAHGWQYNLSSIKIKAGTMPTVD